MPENMSEGPHRASETNSIPPSAVSRQVTRAPGASGPIGGPVTTGSIPAQGSAPHGGSSQEPTPSEQERKKKRYKRLSIIALAVFIVTVTLLILMGATEWMRRQSYKDLSNEVSIDMTDTSSAVQLNHPVVGGRDWQSLQEENPDIRFWLTVENKPIDYPLVQHPTSQEYYLKHGFHGDSTLYGNPFIDVRESATARHLLTYGHHVTGSDQMYSTVNKAWDQAEFNEIGNLTLEMPVEGGGTAYETFYPAFAMQVDQSYETIQEFDFESDDAFRTWLWGMANGAAEAEKVYATAKSENVLQLCSQAHRALTFVTCASDTPNQPERTLITFIATEGPKMPGGTPAAVNQQQAQQRHQQQQGNGIATATAQATSAIQ